MITSAAGRRDPRRTSPRAVSRSSQDPPCGLPYSATTPPSGSNPAAADPLDGVGRLRDERGGLGAARLFGHGGVGQQLG